MKSIAKKDSNQNGKIAREKVVQDVQKMKVSVFKLCQKIVDICQKIVDITMYLFAVNQNRRKE